MRARAILFASMCVGAGLTPGPAAAQWQYGGVPVSTAPNYQEGVVMIPDGSGGAFLAWVDHRSGGMDIYAQRLDAAGAVLWAVNGVGVCTASGNQIGPAIVSDGSGGAIIAWGDYRTGDWDVYAQRVDGSGSAQWTADGVVICSATGIQSHMAIVSDGAGGALMTWQDERGATGWDVYAGRVGAAGSVTWATDGVAVCTAVNDQGPPKLVSDGAGGGIIAWSDQRDGAFNDVYAQRIDASGTTQWTADGVVVSAASNKQDTPEMIMDGSGGAVLAWQDYRNSNPDVYAQRIDASGTTQWTAGGVALCTDGQSQFDIAIGPDGGGGAFVAWADNRGDGDIYAQRVDGSGTVQWTADGAAVCSAAQTQSNPALVADESGGTIIAWQDKRQGFYLDIYAQEVDATGSMQWLTGGVSVCTASNDQNNAVIVANGLGGAIVAWTDNRSGLSDVYADGLPGAYGTGVGDTPPPAKLVVAGNHPNPFNASTELDLNLSERSEVRIDVYDVAGRLVRRSRTNGVKGWQTVRLDARDAKGRLLPSGVYFVRVTAGGETATRKVIVAR